MITILLLMLILNCASTCNKTICNTYMIKCKELCTCDPNFCYCCMPCMICLDNGLLWFECCDCFGLC